MVIPRENNMVRLYIQISSSTDPDFDPRKTATETEVQEAAKRILKPYSIEWERIEWYSVYPIGQGISERYTLDERVFLGGDACHTHSVGLSLTRSLNIGNNADATSKQPKAGQGMNTAFLDAQNLAWKIHAVEGNFAKRDLLKTYEPERKKVAERLLSFDNRYAKLFSQRPPASSEVEAATKSQGTATEEHENEFIRTFKEACAFTSGYGVFYGPNEINQAIDPDTAYALKGIKVKPGYLFINANVTRVADANVVHLEQEVPLNGSFRIFVFAGVLEKTKQALQDFNTGLEDKRSFFSSYLRKDIDQVSHHEEHNPHSLWYTFCTIYANPRTSIEIARDVPKILARYNMHVYADDQQDLCVLGAKASAHAKVGLDPELGGVVVVRPDGYVGMATPLVQGSRTVDSLNEYFAGICTKDLGNNF
jgi:hypothetical protein